MHIKYDDDVVVVGAKACLLSGTGTEEQEQQQHKFVTRLPCSQVVRRPVGREMLLLH